MLLAGFVVLAFVDILVIVILLVLTCFLQKVRSPLLHPKSASWPAYWLPHPSISTILSYSRQPRCVNPFLGIFPSGTGVPDVYKSPSGVLHLPART